MDPMPMQRPGAAELQPVQRLKAWRKALIAFGAIIASIAELTVVTAVVLSVMHKSEQHDMHQIVYSKEADKAFRESLKGLDPLAFTDKGIIHSYEIDETSIKHNPMGGINVTAYVNGDHDLDVSFTLNRTNGTGPLEDDGGGESGKLDDLIEANNKKYGVKPSSYLDATVVGNIQGMSSLLQRANANVYSVVS